MNNTMIFEDGEYPRQFVWNNISFDLNDAITEPILSEPYKDTYAIHKLYGKSGDVWDYHKVMISLYPNKTVITIMKSSDNIKNYDEMRKSCAVLIGGRYRPPTDGRYAKNFPSYDDVCNYTYQQYETFIKSYFLDKV